MHRFLAAVFVASLAAAFGCQHVDHQQYSRPLGPRDYKVDPSLIFHKYELTTLVQNPSQGLNVSLLVIFDQRDEKIWQPFFSGFSPEDYTSFSAWPRESKLWTVEGRTTSVPTFYFRKEGPHYEQVLDAKRYQLVEIKGTVRSTFADRPWIEVYYVIPRSSGPVYSDDSIRYFLTGMEEAEKAPAVAIKNLELALRGDLYLPARIQAHVAVAGLYAAHKVLEDEFKWKKAKEHYDAAVALEPSHRDAAAGAERAGRELEKIRIAAELKANEPPPQPETPK